MKKLKIFAIIVLVLIIAGGSYLLYTFKFKEYDVADDEVKEIVEKEPYKVELPGGATISMDENGEVIEEEGTSGETAGNNAVDGNGESSNNVTGNDGADNSSGTSSGSSNETTVAAIKEKYTPALEGLEDQADTKVNALIVKAKKEYVDKQANGEKINVGYFYNKYMAAAKDLEGNTDKVFDAVLNAVEKDLAANGFDKTEAKAMEEEYEAKKKARRDSILKKALGN
ncbi:hypothetical protein D0S48_08275 [Psychrobacillus sp. AK 1817]|uniref:hypothetical protein n=1 Tax=Psychrobacillus sp. AK 1817 TaxID=2303505 RepID=UPI00124934F7|nr:hypothetical protein [Psychrobacillus sp. AK 1817]QEY20695.1 hypothetical protein D0S48_08275 [Psychrobacillus sp. AK 1817]